MTFQIERLELEEMSAFLRLQAEDSFPDLKNEERLKMLAEKWSTNAECATCRDDEGQLVGMIAFYANGQGANFAYITHVYVSPDYRKKGFFLSMLLLIKEYAKEKGFCEIRLKVERHNNIAIKSYSYSGFKYLYGEDNMFYMSSSI